jgi:hypothetical protein
MYTLYRSEQKKMNDIMCNVQKNGKNIEKITGGSSVPDAENLVQVDLSEHERLMATLNLPIADDGQLDLVESFVTRDKAYEKALVIIANVMRSIVTILLISDFRTTTNSQQRLAKHHQGNAAVTVIS